MKRLLPLLGAVLTLALSSTAAADTFRVVRPASTGVPFTAVQNGPMSFTALRSIWQAAGSSYGIPWEVLAAINKVETDFGRNLGPSSAGAVGWMQFMPSTWARWGMDANGDGVADPDNPTDAIFSAARYLAGCGGQFDISAAVYCYNHASWYVKDVLGLAALYSRGGGSGLFSVDQLQTQLDAARSQVAASNTQLVAVLAQVRKLARAERRFVHRAASARLLSDQLEARKHAVLLGVRRYRLERRAARLRSLLRRATSSLGNLREQASGQSFLTSAGELFSMPASAGSYVFPVGGGPGLVSVGATHHDYPAADIDAPEGAPVYALADATVKSSWTRPKGNCGIGAVITTDDGQTWTYCHLSYLEATVKPGASLAAGAPMGLVGQTGDATGPHLHLQHDPTDVYPQDLSWFRAFAGTAFRWQGAAPTRAVVGSSTPAGPSFAILGTPLDSIPQAAATTSFSTGGGAAFTSDVVYFTH